MFYQLVQLQTLILCSVWMSATPTLTDWRRACPTFNWEWGTVAIVADQLYMRATEISTGEIWCTAPFFENISENPCPGMEHMDRFLLEIVWPDAPTLVCTAAEPDPALCPDPLPEGRLEWRGPYPLPTPEPAEPCILPAVDNSASIATAERYDFLAGRLAWWGVRIDPLDWQNRFDEQIRGAAVAARIPADLLKAMIAVESQFWPLWTGSTDEVGWLQLTAGGADTALRHNEQLFAYYCPQAIHPVRCLRGYDLLAGWEKEQVTWTLLADLSVEGVPTDAADDAAADLWTGAQVLRGFACYARELAPALDTWQAAVVLYNAGAGCLRPEGFCLEGQEYLEKVMR
jgi:hypothetical protein